MAELLAPAGSYECFLAALSAGADAVYLGLKQFGARANAGNFSIEELKQALEIAHVLDKKIYITVNTLFKDHEYEQLYEQINELYGHKIDGVIVQDIGVVEFFKNCFPLIDVHASTQMAITSAEGALFAKRLGITRVVPARELSLAEIENIKEKASIEVECFVHGAMCYSYSGKCLYSSFLGDRSGNRGRCAQPCRLQYDNAYYLSMKDMCTIDIVSELIDAGIDSFKIEGRMKSKEYVYGVTQVYRKYIDSYLLDGNKNICHEDKNKLLSLYTRGGNTKGYYFKKNGPEMITIDFPSYSSDKEPDKHDITDLIDKKVDAKITIDIKAGERIRANIEITKAEHSKNGRSFCFESDFVAQEAINAPISEEMVTKQLVKSGDTLYKITECNVNIVGNVFVPNGQLNSIRRALIEGVSNIIIGEADEYVPNSMSVLKNDSVIENKRPGINVSVLRFEQLLSIVDYDYITGVIIPYSLGLYIFNGNKFYNQSDLINKLRNKDIYISLPYVIREHKKCVGAKQLMDKIRDIGKYFTGYSIEIAGFYISNYEELYLLKNNGYNGKIVGDIHLYAYSAFSAEFLKREGIDYMTVPVELNRKELFRRKINSEELIVYGHMPMMISTQCIKCTKEGCKPNETGYIERIIDRKKSVLNVLCDCATCTNVIYNSIPLAIGSEIEFIKKIKPINLRLMFTCENADDIKNVLTRMQFVIDALGSNHNKGEELCDNYTKGHLNRGVE